MVRSTLTLTVAFASALFGATAVQAEDCDDDCTGIFIFGQATAQSTLQKSRTVNRVVGDRLAPPPGGPAGGGALQYAPDRQTSDPAALAIAGETATLATNDPEMNWNVWFDTSLLYADRSSPAISFDGPLVTASLGADRAIGEASVIGMLINGEYSDFDTGFGAGGNLTSRGFGVGVYAGSALNDHIVADAMLIWSMIDNDLVEFGTSYNYDSSRIQAAANLTGYWYRGAWRLSPTLGVAFTYEDQDSYGATPSRDLTSGIAIAGFQVGHTTFLDDVRTVEPWVGVNAEWEFQSDGVSGFAGSPNLEPFDVRILGGLNAQLSQTTSASLKADVAGLARSGYTTATVGGQVAVRF